MLGVLKNQVRTSTGKLEKQRKASIVTFHLKVLSQIAFNLPF